MSEDAYGGKNNKGRKPKDKKPSLSIIEGGSSVVPLIKGQGKSPEGLTAKQLAFADKVAEGTTLAEAYRHAYDSRNMTAASIHVEASKLMSNPNIAQRVNALLAKKSTKSSHDAARIRHHIIDRLWIESQDTDSPAASRLKALELLGKLDTVGIFKERVATETQDAPAHEVAKTLEARLKRILDKAG